jgi:hypothetical protein
VGAHRGAPASRRAAAPTWRALHAALDLEAPAGASTNILPHTDGEDHVLARAGCDATTGRGTRSRSGSRHQLASGVSLHMAGNCAEADAVLLIGGVIAEQHPCPALSSAASVLRSAASVLRSISAHR